MLGRVNLRIPSTCLDCFQGDDTCFRDDIGLTSIGPGGAIYSVRTMEFPNSGRKRRTYENRARKVRYRVWERQRRRKNITFFQWLKGEFTKWWPFDSIVKIFGFFLHFLWYTITRDLRLQIINTLDPYYEIMGKPYIKKIIRWIQPIS